MDTSDTTKKREKENSRRTNLNKKLKTIRRSAEIDTHKYL